jgi:hypothetical protein
MVVSIINIAFAAATVAATPYVVSIATNATLSELERKAMSYSPALAGITGPLDGAGTLCVFDVATLGAAFGFAAAAARAASLAASFSSRLV